MMALKDKKVLAQIVENYNLQDVILVLAEIAADNADKFTDMSLKEKAIKSAKFSDALRYIAKVTV